MNSEIEKIIPLSPTQEGMLFHSLSNPNSHAYFQQVSFTISGALHIGHIQTCLSMLLERHEALRTIFVYESVQTPVQVVMKERTFPCRYEDIRTLNASEQERLLADEKLKDRSDGFDLSKDVLMRWTVYRISDTEHWFLCSYHHIVMDGWCLGIVLEEFRHMYRKLVAGDPISLPHAAPYSDYIQWRQEKDWSAGEAYWRGYLDGFEQLSALPQWGAHREDVNYLPAEMTVAFDQRLTAALEAIAREQRCTMSSLFQVIWAILLSRYNGTNDVVFGSVISGRPSDLPGSDRMVGLFIQTIPVRVRWDESTTLLELLRKVQEHALNAYEHEGVPLTRIQAQSPLRSRLFDHIVAFENYPVEQLANADKAQASFTIDNISVYEQTNYDLNLLVFPGKELTMKAKFNGNVYLPATIQQLMGHMRNIAASIAGNAQLRVEEIAMFTAEEEKRLLHAHNQTAVEYETKQTIHGMVDAQAQRTPDHPALMMGSQVMTYGQLQTASNQIARWLIAKGIGRRAAVGICLPRGFNLIAAMLGIMKAGAAYVPIEPDYPRERKEAIAANAQLAAVVVHQQGEQFHDNMLSLLDPDVIHQDGGSIEPIADSEDLAYVIFTSGSTGTPKGVMIEHHAVVNLISWVNRTFAVSGSDRLLFMTSVCFDLSVYDIFGPLSSGGSVVIAEGHQVQDPRELVDLLEKHRITFWDSVPAVMNQVALYLEENRPDFRLNDLRTVFLSGDWIPTSLARTLAAYFPHAQPVGLGGATEATIWSNYYLIDRTCRYERSIPYGKPIDNNYFYILDDKLRPVPEGATGELYIGGVGVARGYMNDALRTGSSFLRNPFLPDSHERIYKTGDWGRMRPDGNIEFVGRKDHQVKVRGFRVELGEIEAKLLQHHAVRETVVTVAKQGNSHHTICAYIVAKQEVTGKQLKDYLAQYLPDYMIPAWFELLPCLPMTSNGKIDRSRLPQPSRPDSTQDFDFKSPVEEQLAQLWRQLTGAPLIGRTDHFFEVGGDSLKAMALMSRIQKRFQVRLSVRSIFETPILWEMAEAIDRAASSPAAAIAPAPRSEDDAYPVSSAQKRMFIGHYKQADRAAYNICKAMIVEGRLDADKLSAAFAELADRHESLRTSFYWRGTDIVQKVHSSTDIRLERIELPEEQLAAFASTFVQPFQLEKGSLIRACLITMNPLRHVLMVDMHHIISDGVSLGVLFEEWMALYHGHSLPPAALQYKDYSFWQRQFSLTPEMDKQKRYWLQTWEDGIPKLTMPLDMARSGRRSGGRLTFAFDTERLEQLRSYSRSHNVTLPMLLFALYGVLISKYADQSDLVIGSITAGRHHAGIENTIGIFSNFLPIRFKVRANQRFADVLHEVKQMHVQAYEHQDYPFDEMVEELQASTDPARNPMYDTMLIFHNQAERLRFSHGDLAMKEYPLHTASAVLDLKMDLYIDADERLAGSLEYNAALFHQRSMETLLDRFKLLIDTVLSSPELTMDQLDWFSVEEQQELAAKRRLNEGEAESAYPIVITATFTAEPIVASISYWLQQFKLDADIRVVGYEQVFQQLLDETSLMSKNSGLNLLFIRFDDWIRHGNAALEEQRALLESRFGQLVQAISQRSRSGQYAVGIFPIPAQGPYDAPLVKELNEWNERWKLALHNMGIAVLDFTALQHLYDVDTVWDPLRDELAHIPYTDAFYAAMGTAAARYAVAQRASAYKVIVLDCDNTLWQGVCAEDGLGVTVSSDYAALQQFMLEAHNQGMLLALCSKNHESDVWAIMERHPDMILNKAHFVASKINWLPKWENIRLIGQELSLGLEHFIFIDDNAVECAEMRSHCPEVLTLQLPQDAGQIPHYLRHVWAFDRRSVTEEDRQRTALYHAENRRHAAQTAALSMHDFLQSLDMQVNVSAISESSGLVRAAQLIQKTNQFNFSAIRRNEEQLRRLLQVGYFGWSVQASDRFGHYGTIGVLLAAIQQDVLFVDTFLLSCRVLGRQVEDAMLHVLHSFAVENGLRHIEIAFVPNERNEPVKQFIERIGLQTDRMTEDGYVYRIRVDQVPAAPGFISLTLSLRTSSSLPDIELQPVSGAQSAVKLPLSAQRYPSSEDGSIVSPAKAERWQQNILPDHNSHHNPYYKPLQYYRANDLAVHLNGSGAAERAESEENEGQHESTANRLERIWRKVLKKDVVHWDDSFFAIGGDSLKAIQLLSEIHTQFQLKLSLDFVFAKPAFRAMMKAIEEAEDKHALSRIPAAEADASGCYPVSSAQRRLLIQSELDANSTSYNMPLAFWLKGDVDHARLERTFQRLIERHEPLRTCFLWKEGLPVQHVLQQLDWQLPYTEWLHTETDLDEKLQTFIQPFDVQSAPLFRAELLKLPDNRYLLLLDMHHIITDGSSMDIFLADFISLHEGKDLPALRIQYKDFAVWESASLQPSLADAEAYWLQRFAERAPELSLPTDGPRPPVRAYEGSKVSVQINKEMQEALQSLALEEGVTLYTLLLASYFVLLAQYSGMEDIVVGTPAAGRTHADVEPLMGMFVHTLALRGEPKLHKPFGDFVRELQEQALQAFKHQHFPFDDLVSKLQLPRQLNRHPLFDTMFAYRVLHQWSSNIAGMELEPYAVAHGTIKYDLKLDVTDRSSGLHLSMEYDAQLYKPSSVTCMLEDYMRVLEMALQDRSRPIHAFELADRYTLLEIPSEMDFDLRF